MRKKLTNAQVKNSRRCVPPDALVFSTAAERMKFRFSSKTH